MFPRWSSQIWNILIVQKITWKTNVVVYMINVPTVEEDRVSLNTVSAKCTEKIIVVVVYMISGLTVGRQKY